MRTVVHRMRTVSAIRVPIEKLEAAGPFGHLTIEIPYLFSLPSPSKVSKNARSMSAAGKIA